MDQERPGIITVLGTTSIILGVLGLLCSCAGLASLLVLANPGDLRSNLTLDRMIQEAEYLAAEVPGYRAVEIGNLVAGMILAPWLLITGLGLLAMRPWARTGSLIYAAVKILLELAYLVNVLLIVNPALEHFQPRGQQPPQWSPALRNHLALLGAVLGMTYAIILMALLVKRWK